MLRRICCWLQELLRHLMTDDHPAYHFRVQSPDGEIKVAEVSGLEVEFEIIEYRDGSDPSTSVRKSPGLQKFSNLVLKRGVVAGNNDFFQWLNAAREQGSRRDLVITLLDEAHEPVALWRVRRAFPCKYSGPNLKADGNEVAIETLELAHEGLEVETA